MRDQVIKSYEPAFQLQAAVLLSLVLAFTVAFAVIVS